MFKKLLSLLLGTDKKKPVYALVPKQQPSKFPQRPTRN
jgi:hypothetical protein